MWSALGKPTSTSSLTLPTVSDFFVTPVTAGSNFACGNMDGTLVCWGTNSVGQLGRGTTSTSEAEPAAVQLTGAYLSISAGSQHVCITRNPQTFAYSAQCWGSNAHGQLGDGTEIDRNVPTNVNNANITIYNSFAGGAGHNCGITNAQQLLCWGSNGMGQLGVGDTTARSIPAKVLDPAGETNAAWLTATAGDENTCGITSFSNVYCWGYGFQGTNGNGDSMVLTNLYSPASPINLGSMTNPQYIAGVGDTMYAWNTSGEMAVWGDNFYGQCGAGSGQRQFNSPHVVSGLGILKVVSGLEFACLLTKLENSATEVQCFGHNDGGALGIGNNVDQRSPVSVAPDAGQTWDDIVTGRYAAYGIQGDARGYPSSPENDG